MSIFSRISDIVSANINALLDRCEDPERMIAQIVREMEEGLAQARRYTATAIAAERRLTRELEHSRADVQHWYERARTALDQGREDLARRALIRKKEHEALARGLEMQLEQARSTSARVRACLRALEARLAEARRKQRVLLARQRAAQAQFELHRAFGAGIGGLDGPGARLNRLENRLLDWEDELAAQAELANGIGNDLEQELADLQTTREIEEELVALKATGGAGRQGETAPRHGSP
jgi:phage shock protein A